MLHKTFWLSSIGHKGTVVADGAFLSPPRRIRDLPVFPPQSTAGLPWKKKKKLAVAGLGKVWRGLFLVWHYWTWHFHYSWRGYKIDHWTSSTKWKIDETRYQTVNLCNHLHVKLPLFSVVCLCKLTRRLLSLRFWLPSHPAKQYAFVFMADSMRLFQRRGSVL